MKVLQINAVSGIRSTGRTCVEMADWLNENGHEGYIAYSSGIPHKKSYKIGSAIEKKAHSLFSRVFGNQAYYSKPGTKKLLNFIKKLRPEIVHLRNLHSNFINLELLLNYLAKNDIPTLISLHDCWFFTGKCTHYTLDNCNKWQTECGNCPRLKKDNPSWFFDRTKKMHGDKKKWFQAIPRLGVVGVSDWITNEARKSFLAEAKIITRIYNWIDLDVFKPVDASDLRKELGLQGKFVLLGVASGWSNAKGLNKYIALASKQPSDTIIILVGGMQAGIKLPANILHIKETHNISELVQYYSMADVYLHLSPEETFGKTTAEALACGTPAIVVNSTANPELIGPGCGYVVEENNPDSLFEKIMEIKTKGKQDYSEACRGYAQKSFDKKDNLLQTIELYEKLIEL